MGRLLRWVGTDVRIFAAAKIAHLIDDRTVAKMGHPVVVVRSDVGHPAAAAPDRGGLVRCDPPIA
jgi:hypothetical protein